MRQNTSAIAGQSRLAHGKIGTGYPQTASLLGGPSHAFSIGGILSVVALHVLLALLMQRYSFVATIHVFVTVTCSLGIAAVSPRWEDALAACSYLCGCEVLWRATRANFFWEGTKYAICLVSLLIFIRHARKSTPMWPLLYFLLHLPAVIVTFFDVDIQQSRQLISGNISGPLTIGICCMAFGGREVDSASLSRVMLSYVGPVISLATIASMGTLSLDADSFGKSSNLEASGGYGPNQVAMTLALAGVLMFLIPLVEGRIGFKASICYALFIYLIAQSAMTFSRSGLYASALSLAVGSFLLFRLKKFRVMTTAAILIGVFLASLVFPSLDEFTEGKLSDRFDNKSGTGREEIAKGDIEVGIRTFPWGAGIGQGRIMRGELTGEGRMSHTEYARLFAEHSLFGLCALACLGYALILRLFHPNLGISLAWSGTMITFALLFMLVSATRLAIPGLTLALGLLIVKGDQRLREGKIRPPMINGPQNVPQRHVRYLR